jgi:hypothetical protein
MKKFITMLLVGLMVLSSSIVAFAEEPSDTSLRSFIEEGQDLRVNRTAMKELNEYTEEIHQINALRIERNRLQIQVIENQDKLVDLFNEAKEAGNREALAAAKEERKQIKVIRDEIKVLQEQAAAARKAFREAVKNNEKETADAEIKIVIDTHSSINDKIEEKIEVLDSIVDILS